MTGRADGREGVRVEEGGWRRAGGHMEAEQRDGGWRRGCGAAVVDHGMHESHSGDLNLKTAVIVHRHIVGVARMHLILIQLVRCKTHHCNQPAGFLCV